ncbi:hypothetical protein [Paenibacillus sp. B2(2019)]|uniref:hypothetical protein n=1 Tax=Paenibacillus sp. B2(2019) TaxID=2607754 RepID=UPI0011F29701|nr:hypothetical protein [Paenibacillus sp. B2(2019)]KAA1180898.1 hypothetical protein PAENI_27065 [Paenibacillus sp. B2(2019)]
MNTRQSAEKEINDFLNSDESVILITGTHQYQKHILVLEAISEVKCPSILLFRANSMKNFGTILEDHTTTYKTGYGYKFGPHRVYVDSIKSTSWTKTPYAVDFSIVYPIDSVCKNNGKEKIIQDIVRRTNNKVFLISWTDNYDCSWLDEFIDRKVIYDVEEEDPEYHARMLKSLKKF